MKTYFRTYLAISIISVFALSCQNDNTNAKLVFSTIDSNGTQKKSLSVLEFQFDSASMVLNNIVLSKTLLDDFETIEDSLEYFDNLKNTSASFYGPYRLDLIEGTSSPDIDMVEVEPGLYSILEARMGNGLGDSVSFYLSGTAVDDIDEISFEFKFAQGSSFELENPSGFEMIQNQINVVWVKIDLNMLFEGVDLGIAEEDNDGVVRINKDSNDDMIELIIQNLIAASELGLDMDMDGKIDNSLID